MLTAFIKGTQMKLFEEGTFKYNGDKLFCENVSVEEIINSVGTPAYIYSKNFFEDKYKEFDSAFENIKHSIFYACKSNFNLNVIKIFASFGSGIDVNSGGELFRAIKAGVEPQKIILSGVGKTKDEIKLALEHKIKLIKIESFEEVQLIDKIARELNLTAPIAIRVNPNVDAKTHPYISTGLSENKFGIDSFEAVDFFERCAQLKNISVTGIDMHIGSQILTVEPFIEATEKLAELYTKIKSKGIPLEHLDIGGGFGVRYKNEKTFSPKELADAIIPIIKNLDCEIMFEPGRYFTANAGILVTEILYSKQNKGKNFIVVDAAMTELFRPSLYGAYHHIQPINLNERKEILADVVGPVCESSDFLAKNRKIEYCNVGDKLAVMSSGAYGMAMSSNYNGRRRPPEVIVSGDKFFITRSRETFEHLLYDEKIVKDLF